MLTILGKESTASTYARCEPSTSAADRIVQRRPATYTVVRALFGKVVQVDAGQPHDETVK
jgi:hypothetical protein